MKMDTNEQLFYCDWRSKGWEISGNDDNLYEAVIKILNRYEEALAKHPDNWPNDVIHMTAIMAEEAGEAIQAANNAVHEGESLEPLRQELAQTAAMCIRCLINLEDR